MRGDSGRPWAPWGDGPSGGLSRAPRWRQKHGITRNQATGRRDRRFSGIGRELAAQFAENGYDLVVAAEDDRIGPAAGSFAEHGIQAVPVLTDLATFDGVEELYQAIQATGRTPEALAINAGVGVGHGGVLFTSSIAATAPGPYHATYPASKAFLLSFAEALRYELRDSGVTVTALMPGPTDTEFFDRAGMQGTKLREQTPKDEPAEVAREGFEALVAGKDHVIAGSAKNKAQAAAGKVLPETAKAGVQAKETRPGSGE